MFITSIVAAALLTSSTVSAFAVVPRGKPATYYESYLEPYKQYHTRYLAINCQKKHNTQFFDDCCHPMLKTETLAKNRKAYCKPSAAASSSASVAEPTSTVVPTPEDQVPAPPNDDDDEEDGDDDEEECDDDDDDDGDDSPTVPPPSASSSPASKPPPATSAPPKTTPKPTATATKTSSTPKPTSSQGSGDFKTGGIATFYTQNGVAGACGKVHKDSDLIAALTSTYYGSFSKKSSNCGRQIEVFSVDHPDRKVIVTAQDACPTCPQANSLDLSTAAFLKLATKNEGIAKIKWRFIS